MSTLDLVILVLLFFTALRGYQKGLILSLFGMAAYFIGLLAALKFSASVASHFQPANQWTPFLAFLLIFFSVSWIIFQLGKTIKKAGEILMMGWLDKAGGMLLHILTFCMIAGLILFYAEQMKIIPADTARNSIFLSYLNTMGPQLFEKAGNLLPFCSDILHTLRDYFNGIESKISP